MAQSRQNDPAIAPPPADADETGAAASGAVPAPADDMPKQPKPGDLKRADAVSDGNIADAEPTDEPVRSAAPDVPVMQTLKVGAGGHRAPDPALYDPDGRYNPGWQEREAEGVKAASGDGK